MQGQGQGQAMPDSSTFPCHSLRKFRWVPTDSHRSDSLLPRWGPTPTPTRIHSHAPAQGRRGAIPGPWRHRLESSSLMVSSLVTEKKALEPCSVQG